MEAGVEHAVATLLLGDPSRDVNAAMTVLREQEPVAWVEALQGWYVTRFDDVHDLFADPRATADPRAYDQYQLPSEGPARHWMGAFPFLSSKPGIESRGRRMATRELSRSACARLEPLVGAVVEERMAPLRAQRGVVDLVSAFTAPVPASVVSRWTGVPQGEDERRFRELAHKSARGASPVLSPKKRKKTEEAVIELSETISALARERRSNPRDDLTSNLIRTYPSEDLDEIVRVVGGLVATGAETTTRASTNSMRLLLRDPALLERLMGDRERIPQAVHELMRFEAPLAHMSRFAVCDFELRGRSIRKGQLLVLSIQSAQRDPAVFEKPDQIDFDREPENLLAFGRGAHYCVGVNLAWLQLRLMMNALLDLVEPGARLLEDQIKWGGRGALGRVKTLPVDLGPA